MSLTTGQIARTGSVRFTDAALRVWEEGLAGLPWDQRETWERQFKRDVFARIVQTMNRLGWTVSPSTHIFTSNNARYCKKGDLQADLRIGGRSISLEFFQNVNAPDRPDHGGRYQFEKEKHMPYVLRLEMERTRRRVRDYLCNVFTGYEFEPEDVRSPNPDPLAYFNDKWDMEYDKKRGVHRFHRGADGWPSDKELSSWSRTDKDGAQLNHGDVRWYRDQKGRLLRGRVYGGINGMWLFVYGPGRRDFAQDNASRFFSYQEGKTPRKLVDARLRIGRLKHELAAAVAQMDFKRAEVLKHVLYPEGAPAAIAA